MEHIKPDHSLNQKFARTSRRSVLAGAIAAGIAGRSGTSRAQNGVPVATGILLRDDAASGGLVLHDPATGAKTFAFATDGHPEAAWASAMPGVAFVQTDRALALANCETGESMSVALPQEVAIGILPKSIQFRGSRGTAKQLIGTADSAGDTYLVDLTTGERTNVMGLITATPPPVTLQNVALASDDITLLVWDGRRTWLVDLLSNETRMLGSGQFTFSAGFMADGLRIVYSQEMATGKTQLRIQNLDGTGDELLYESDDILVSLPIPDRNALLLDERSDSGGILGFHEFEPNSAKAELLAYTGATNVVQFSPDGSFALVGIEGEAGRDWYRLELKKTGGSALLFDILADAEVQPGFAFDSDWAIASIGADDINTGSVIAVDLINGETTAMIEGIATDALVGSVEVALHGPGALVTIDSFTEFAVHFLDLEIGEDRAVDLMKGGSGVVSPTGDGFAVAFDLNTGGNATIVYDAAGQEQITIPGKVLAWVLI